MKKIKNYIYRLNDNIGAGKYSTVYAGIDDIKQMPVAVKVIQIDNLPGEAIYHMF
jgi:hypothetical protein